MNRRFKVLNICSWYPNDLKLTLGNFVQKHAESIALYNDVISLAIFPDTNVEKHRMTINEKDNLVELVIYYPKRIAGVKFINRIINFWNHVKSFRMGYRIVKDKFQKPDIVHLNIVYPLGIWAYWLKKRYRIPYVITENSSGFHVTSDHAYPKPILKLCQRIIKNANFILPVSLNLKENLKLLNPSGQFDIISNVVDENLFISTDSKSTTNKRLIHISTGVDEIKNLTGMIHVMHELKSQNCTMTLDIVSDGDIEYARKLASDLKLDNVVTFHSTKTTSEIAEMIQASDALLMFSNYENFPCVIAEAMMCGKPVISSNVNGIPEHVHEFNGVLVNPRDEKALAHEIKRFAYGELTFDAREIRTYALANFSYSEVGKKFTAIYKKILS
jgi:glycosyltransferase involved in cell wall biosynthesis